MSDGPALKLRKPVWHDISTNLVLILWHLQHLFWFSYLPQEITVMGQKKPLNDSEEDSCVVFQLYARLSWKKMTYSYFDLQKMAIPCSSWFIWSLCFSLLPQFASFFPTYKYSSSIAISIPPWCPYDSETSKETHPFTSTLRVPRKRARIGMACIISAF